MSMVDDEIDLRPYILAVLRFKWLLILAALVMGIIGFMYTARQPQLFKATATLLVIRNHPTLKLADQFPTVAESVDTAAKLRAFLAIAKDPAIAVASIEEMSNKLPEGKRQPERLNSIITVESQGDLILISATDPDPKLAAEIANSWAAQTAKSINQAYAEGSAITDIELQLADAQKQYEAAQASLEGFIRENESQSIERQISETRFILTSLINQRAKRLDFYNQRAYSLEHFIVQAESLKNQLESGSQSTAGELGDAIAILNARANAYGIAQVLQNADSLSTIDSSAGSSSNLSALTGQQPSKVASFSIDVSVEELISNGDTSADFADDLEQIIELARVDLSKAQELILSLTMEEQDTESSSQVAQVNTRLQELETRLEQQKARQRELSNDRDLTWQAYTALIEKKAELQTSTQTKNEVSLANQAIVPMTSLSRGGMRNALIAGAGGFMLAFLVILTLVWWRQINLNQTVQPAPTSRSS